MNKGDLIKKIQSDAKITKGQASAALESVTSTIGGSLKKGERVTLIGFGTFNVVKRAARKGRNPQTGKPLNISARKVVKFKTGAALQKKVK
jgi:DNA-binding protein HU-beta